MFIGYGRVIFGDGKSVLGISPVKEVFSREATGLRGPPDPNRLVFDKSRTAGV